jgi:hypothetical protein
MRNSLGEVPLENSEHVMIGTFEMCRLPDVTIAKFLSLIHAVLVNSGNNNFTSVYNTPLGLVIQLVWIASRLKLFGIYLQHDASEAHE